MCVVERNEVSQRAHVCLVQTLKIVRDLCPKFVKQRGELVTVVSEYIPRVSIHDCCAETRHHIEGVIGKGDCLFIARDAASVIAVIEIAHVATDTFALQRAALKKWCVISLRRLHDAQQNRDIRHRARHWPGGVLLMTDRNDPVLRNQTERRLQTENDCAGRTQVLNQRRISGDLAAVECERTGSSLQVIECRDVVFDQQRNSVKWATDMTSAPLVIKTGRDRNGVRIGFNDRMQCGIELLYAV